MALCVRVRPCTWFSVVRVLPFRRVEEASPDSAPRDSRRLKTCSEACGAPTVRHACQPVAALVGLIERMEVVGLSSVVDTGPDEDVEIARKARRAVKGERVRTDDDELNGAGG